MLSKKILSSIPNSVRIIRRLAAGSLASDITFQQFRVLNLTFEGEGQTQMAQTLQVSMAAVSKMVDALEKKGFLIREQGSDRRCLTLKLSIEGLKRRKVVTDHVEKTFEKKIKKLSKEEQNDLIKGLDVLDKLMGHVNEK